MSIESLLKANIDALEANTAAQLAVAEVLKSGKPAAAKKAPAKKEAPAEEAPAEEAPAEEKPAAKPKTKPRPKKAASPDKQRAALLLEITAYMGEAKKAGKEDATSAFTAVKTMLEFVGAEDPSDGKFKVPNIPDDRIEEAVGYFANIKEGETPDYPNADNTEEADDDDMTF